MGALLQSQAFKYDSAVDIDLPAGLSITIELSKIHDNARNLLPCHSGEGRNPALLFKMQLGVVPQCGACWTNWISAFTRKGYAVVVRG